MKILVLGLVIASISLRDFTSDMTQQQIRSFIKMKSAKKKLMKEVKELNVI
jgi:hypothetical protein